jgi:hypothetical protein
LKKEDGIVTGETVRERLTDAVHLIVMPALGEGKELSFEIREPGGLVDCAAY